MSSSHHQPPAVSAADDGGGASVAPGLTSPKPPPVESESYLDRIVAQRLVDIAAAKAAVPEAELRARIAHQPPPRSLIDAIEAGAPMAVLAEFKRASPSKGDIAVHLDATEQALAYAGAGATVVSVLTEEHWFKGSLADLSAVSAGVRAAGHERVAVLRKDFLLDGYQLLEARAAGADTALLIVACLDEPTLAALIRAARELGMEPLVEVNGVAELGAALRCGARVLGVNNRDLRTFVVDPETVVRVGAALREAGPAAEGVRLISLSGVSSGADVLPALRAGAVGVLVGEALMRAQQPAKLVGALREAALHEAGKGARHEPQPPQPPPRAGAAEGAPTPPPFWAHAALPSGVAVKVCGLTRAEDGARAAAAGADLCGLIFAPASKRRVDAAGAKAVAEAVRAAAGTPAGAAPVAVARPPAAAERAFSAADAAAWYAAGAAALSAARAAAGRPLLVGVFQDQPLAEIEADVGACGLELVQLHGAEQPELASALSVPAIKVLHVRPGEEGGAAEAVLRDAAAHAGHAVGLLLDTATDGARGGTGVAFDWALAATVGRQLPVLVAGGLSGENVAQAVRAAQPCWGVDASSGLESAPGVKEPAAIDAYVHAAKRAKLA